MEPVQPKPSEVHPQHFRVLTWNVLMSYYAKKSNYPYAKAEWLAREYRDSLAVRYWNSPETINCEQPSGADLLARG